MIPVASQDRALKFYTEKLGFEVSTDAECGEGHQRWIELDLPEGNTRVVLFTHEGYEDRVGTSQPVVFATTGNVKDVYETLKNKGVKFLSEPVEEPWGTYVNFQDSEGNEFILSAAD